MKKYGFISQPMRGLTSEQITAAREKAVKYLTEHGYEVLETYFADEFEKSNAPNKPLLYLGESIKYLAKASIAYFCNGWEDARGCRVEWKAAQEYGVEVVYEKDV
jgi:hypothetical protein|uniref:N-deoxyribosyltransferase n=1 Tax=Podoviridae sp. ctxkP1 TaxID=2826591 RepID=A0A8S5QSC9_9CAUD|nr:MAG TPA: N-deoxyribosyltransferase [Podoviridae sp. ctxkP1]